MLGARRQDSVGRSSRKPPAVCGARVNATELAFGPMHSAWRKYLIGYAVQRSGTVRHHLVRTVSGTRHSADPHIWGIGWGTNKADKRKLQRIPLVIKSNDPLPLRPQVSTFMHGRHAASMRAREFVSYSCPTEGLKHAFRWVRRVGVFANFGLVVVGSLQNF